MPDFTTLSMAHGRPRIFAPLHPDVQPHELADGALCSVDEAGCIRPFNEALKFGGLIDGVGRQHGRVMVSAVIDDFLLVRLDGLSSAAPPGATVYATRLGGAECFSLNGPGAAIGELFTTEGVEAGTAVIKIQATPRQQKENV